MAEASFSAHSSRYEPSSRKFRLDLIDRPWTTIGAASADSAPIPVTIRYVGADISWWVLSTLGNAVEARLEIQRIIWAGGDVLKQPQPQNWHR
jgi:hypothetical protein